MRQNIGKAAEYRYRCNPHHDTPTQWESRLISAYIWTQTDVGQDGHRANLLPGSKHH